MLTKIFYKIDNFCKHFQKEFEKHLLQDGSKILKSRMAMSEIMTIVIYFHHSGYRNFKKYYLEHICQYKTKAFPNRLSYNRFVELMQSVLIPMIIYFQQCAKGKVTGISFVDSTSLKVCDNRRINQHKVFCGLARRGKTSMGWFYGFKLHLVVNDQGQIINFKLTEGNTDDRNSNVFSELKKGLFGKLFADRGYISKKLTNSLIKDNIELITKLKKNMKPRVIPAFDKVLLRKRAVIETINDELKNIMQIEHSRHRSPHNFLVNLVSGIIAYQFKTKKPSIRMTKKDIEKLSNLPMVI